MGSVTDIASSAILLRTVINQRTGTLSEPDFHCLSISEQYPGPPASFYLRLLSAWQWWLSCLLPDKIQLAH